MAKAKWLKVDPSQGSGNVPYTPPMEIFAGKHYIEDGVVYRCIRDSGIALTHSLNSLVGLYVEAL